MMTDIILIYIQHIAILYIIGQEHRMAIGAGIRGIIRTPIGDMVAGDTITIILHIIGTDIILTMFMADTVLLIS